MNVPTRGLAFSFLLACSPACVGSDLAEDVAAGAGGTSAAGSAGFVPGQPCDQFLDCPAGQTCRFNSSGKAQCLPEGSAGSSGSSGVGGASGAAGSAGSGGSMNFCDFVECAPGQVCQFDPSIPKAICVNAGGAGGAGAGGSSGAGGFSGSAGSAASGGGAGAAGSTAGSGGASGGSGAAGAGGQSGGAGSAGSAGVAGAGQSGSSGAAGSAAAAGAGGSGVSGSAGAAGMTAGSGGAPTCEGSKCGPGQECVIQGGEPVCVAGSAGSSGAGGSGGMSGAGGSTTGTFWRLYTFRQTMPGTMIADITIYDQVKDASGKVLPRPQVIGTGDELWQKEFQWAYAGDTSPSPCSAPGRHQLECQVHLPANGIVLVAANLMFPGTGIGPTWNCPVNGQYAGLMEVFDEQGVSVALTAVDSTLPGGGYCVFQFQVKP